MITTVPSDLNRTTGGTPSWFNYLKLCQLTCLM